MDKINDSGQKQQNMASFTTILTVVDKGALHIFIGQPGLDPGDRHCARLVWVHAHGCKNCQDTGKERECAIVFICTLFLFSINRVIKISRQFVNLKPESDWP